MSHIFSPSQIASFLECERKWGWATIAKIRVPQNASAGLGDRVHKQLERYLETGETPDFTEVHDLTKRNVGYIAAAGLHLLPAPRTPGLSVEGWFKFTSSATGITYRGRRDWHIHTYRARETTIGDHKTTSNLKWMKTPDALRTDPQGVIYAAHDFHTYDVERVNLHWNYFQTTLPHTAKPVHLTVERGEVSHQFARIELVTLRMLHMLDSNKQPLDLEPNVNACESYGGCPYRHLCNLSPVERAKAQMVHGLRAEGDVPMSSLLAKIREKKAAAVVSSEEVSLTVPALDEAPIAINPPEWQPPPTADERERQEAEAKGKNAVKKLEAEKAASSFGTAPERSEYAEKVGEEKPKRTRAKKYVVEEIAPGVVAVDVVAPGQPEVANDNRISLFVDCVPIGFEVTSADEIIGDAKKALKAEGIEDYRLVDYGKGAAHLLKAFEDACDNGGYTAVVVDSRTPEGSIVLSALTSRAHTVVRGLR